ncbi:Delta-like protein [Nesidiocoris tenuis]|uniref:Delta-like protein n=1 Tax=Nesidiocoris tenuis TaxID=355587 RepID=A0ABN7APY4_9HEMI|nr:Delta-like protein [Nesidiocoris tenuis]
MLVSLLCLAALLSSAIAADSNCVTGLGSNYSLWGNNQTHELHVMIEEKPSDCAEVGTPCPAQNGMTEASADLQSGDILLVYINVLRAITPPRRSPTVPSTLAPLLTTPASPRSTLTTKPSTASSSTTVSGSTKSAVEGSTSKTSVASTTSAPVKTTSAAASTITTTPEQPILPPLKVYSFSKPGPTDCNIDLAEGVPVDVAPIAFDGSSLLTFYDKDLTEGVNVLLIVSDSWDNLCAKLRVTVKSQNCGDSEDCSGKGACYANASMEEYECQCCPGYIGPHCEERDACYQNPCKNNGICVDISQGHDGAVFQCLCPYGFTGKICEDTSDPCEAGPCKNGGRCRPSNETAYQFKCSCPPGYNGQFCQHAQDMCSSNPCKRGICVDQHDGYRCFCQPGFTGANCQDEYNECESSPCLNGGTCSDHIDSYSCTCDRGYTGNRCQIKMNLCDPNPCSPRHICKDKGNTFTCECSKGYTGANCLIPIRAACSANPCRNGGTCWSSVDSFYCACRPGYTGKICNEEVIIEVIPSASDTIEVDGSDPNIDVQMPLGGISRAPVSIHLDHLHNVYVAAGTLACAVLIVIVTVIICHCRMHETYKHCCFRSSPLLPCSISRFDSVIKKNGLERDKEPLAQARPFPALDSSDVYYALDFSDSQSSPLIQ